MSGDGWERVRVPAPAAKPVTVELWGGVLDGARIPVSDIAEPVKFTRREGARVDQILSTGRQTALTYRSVTPGDETLIYRIRPVDLDNLDTLMALDGAITFEFVPPAPESART